jgi:hypothetical protein
MYSHTKTERLGSQKVKGRQLDSEVAFRAFPQSSTARSPCPNRLRIIPHRALTKPNNPTAPIALAGAQKHTRSQRRSARPQPSRTPEEPASPWAIRQEGEVSFATGRRNRKTGDGPFSCLPAPIQVAIDLRESYISFNSGLPNPYLDLSYWRRQCSPAA